MKKLIIAACLFTIILSCQKERDNRIPQCVYESFEKKYPEATELKWEELDNQYEAKFSINGQNKEVLFASNGNILIEESKKPRNLME